MIGSMSFSGRPPNLIALCAARYVALAHKDPQNIVEELKPEK